MRSLQSWRAAGTRLNGPPRMGIRQRKYSTARSTSNATLTRTGTYIAAASVITGTGTWWLTSAFKDSPSPKSGKHNATKLGLSKDEVTELLSQEAYIVKTSSTVERYDGARLASNSPCEDRFTHGQLSVSSGEPWMAWAVFDGHAGSQTADLLERQLLPLMQERLSQVDAQSNVSDADSVQDAITKAFMDFDDSLIRTAEKTAQSDMPLHEKMQRLMPAFAGSCALLSLYDPTSKRLHVACTGDSRAVLGQQKADGTWEAIPLSIDQTGSNESEIARLHREHPGEEEIVKGGRVLGLMVSRAFGDGRWKWSGDLQNEFVRRFHAPALRAALKDNTKTPPYITAEPVVTTTVIDSKKPSFLILETDGLWDNLTNQQAVDLVGRWLQQPQANATVDGKPEPARVPFDFGSDVKWEFEEGRTTTQDNNAAVHLMRNSLGGNDHELIAARLATSTPFSREVRDDITIQVAFFNCTASQ
ncbi:putative pyruvate dehydrogenase [Aureobasidium subglaciale]|nr:putative pyruvate dehydrogenase [Aureobasidium subglaciale]